MRSQTHQYHFSYECFIRIFFPLRSYYYFFFFFCLLSYKKFPDFFLQSYQDFGYSTTKKKCCGAVCKWQINEQTNKFNSKIQYFFWNKLNSVIYNSVRKRESKNIPAIYGFLFDFLFIIFISLCIDFRFIFRRISFLSLAFIDPKLVTKL